MTTGGYLHLVLFRAHCCCCELRAAGQAHSYLLLVQKPKRHIPTYLKYYDTPSAGPCSLAIHASGNNFFIELKPHATRTDTCRRSCLTRNAPHPKHPRLKKHFFSSRNPMYLLAAAINTECDISGMLSMQPTEHPRTSPRSLLRTFTGVGCLASNRDWRSRSSKIYVGKDEEDRTGLGRDLLC